MGIIYNRRHVKPVAAIDQGTTSTRCIVFDEARHCHPRNRNIGRFCRAGWVEHDATRFWSGRRTLSAGAKGRDEGGVAAIGITNQRETTVVWDRRTGRPVCNAIVWQDTRTQDMCDAVAAKMEAWIVFARRRGCRSQLIFRRRRLSWILDHIPRPRAAAERGEALFGTIDSWLIWNLTGGADGGVHVTDVTNASRTMLMNLHMLDWDDELLEAFEVPRAMLPRITSSSQPGGWGVTRKISGLPAEIPICGNLGDQQAALVGQGCSSPAIAKIRTAPAVSCC